MEEYREPFVGGGGVLFAADGFRCRWVNDLSTGLIAVSEALRDRPADFLARCRAVADVRAEFARVAFDDNADPAYRYFLVNRTGYGGMVNYRLRCRTRCTNPEDWNVVAGDRLGRAAALLAGVRVTCGDFAPLLSEPGKDVWVYCDPPYVTSRDWPAARVYEHHFTEEDHRRFADAVKRSPHKVAVSYGDDAGGLARSLFPKSEGFHVVEGSWRYGYSTDAVKRPARELLILNYPPPAGATTLRAPDRGRQPAGRKPTDADAGKRRAVLALLANPDSAGHSVARLARTAGVSQHYVGKVLKESGVARSQVRGANGKTYPARIGTAA